jgi:hypothetical protein
MTRGISCRNISDKSAAEIAFRAKQSTNCVRNLTGGIGINAPATGHLFTCKSSAFKHLISRSTHL